MSTTTIDDLTDQLLSKIFRNLVDVNDFRKCRRVSQRWKRTVTSACGDKFHVLYPLTDSTLNTVHELKGATVSFDIYSFTGKENKKAWSKSGIELLMRTTEWIQFGGSEVSTSEFRKILGLAKDSLKTLSFKCHKKNLLRPLLEMQVPFSALRNLSIGYYTSAVENNPGPFNKFTNTLEKWISLDCKVQLPLLESLNLYFDGRAGNGNTTIFISSEDLFRNYIATAKLLLKYKQTLRKVQINRIFQFNVQFHHRLTNQPHMFPPEWIEMERGLEALDELNLNRLQLFTTFADDWHPIEIEVFGRPKNLKNLIFQNAIFPYFDPSPLLIATLSSFNNMDGIHLTSLKINLIIRDLSDPTLVVNLGVLRECINLRTLWLIVCDRSRREKFFVRNLELLPKGISVFRCECVNDHLYSFDHELHLNRHQIRWIIDNLRELESFWASFVIPDRTNENDNNEQIDNAAGADNNANAQPQDQEDINRLVNINLDTFRDLIAMPKLKDIRGNMIKVRRFAAIMGLPNTLEAIQEYSDLCNAAGYTTTTTPHPFRIQVYRFATLKI